MTDNPSSIEGENEMPARPAESGYERKYDLPWCDKKVAVLTGMLKLQAFVLQTEEKGYGKGGRWTPTTSIALKSGESERDVRHYSYHARAGGLVEITPGKEHTFQLTQLGYDTMTYNPMQGGGPGTGADPSKMQELRNKVTSLQAAMAESRKEHDQQISGLTEQVKLLRKQAEEAGNNIKEVHVIQDGKIVRKIEGLFHAKFNRMLTLAQARKNIFIYGPTGSGKSFICEQIANSLNLRYSHISCTNGMSEGALAGKLLPTGKGGQFEYITSEFVRCFEEGGVFLLDEMDAADANVLLVINTALANGRLAVSSRPKKPYAERHPDFICIAACNTVGTGADRQYSGRNKLDGSTLDRFSVGRVYMDYDKKLEEQLCPDPDLLTQCWKVRTRLNGHQLERAMSTRFIAEAYHMKTHYGWTTEELFGNRHDGYFAGWREDEFNKVRSAITADG